MVPRSRRQRTRALDQEAPVEVLSRRPGAKAFVVHGGKLLFLQRDRGPAAGRWNLPGGALESGESPDEAILREMEEEVGVRPRTWIYLGWHDHPDGTRVHRHLIRLDADEVELLKPGNEEPVFKFHEIEGIQDLPTTDRLKTYLLSVQDQLRAIVERGEAPDSAALRLTR